ncbi:MAG TPA: hypothetical protein VMH03_13655 [Terriglobales bacterium]|nr:hypothetical protein [Terriglobales bacterium]
MFRDEQFARAARPEHFDPHQDRRYDHGVKTVHSNCINRVQISERLPFLACEGYVASNLLDRATGFHTADYVPPRQMLVFEAHVRLGENADLRQTADRPVR